MPYRTILAPLDPAGGAGEICAHARLLAQAFGARVIFLHVIDAPSRVNLEEGSRGIPLGDAMEEEIRFQLRSFELSFPAAIRTEILVRRGEVAPTILRIIAERDADLVVMGTHGRAGLRRLVLGSVAEQVLRSSPVPVLVVHEAPGAADAPIPGGEQIQAGIEG